MTDTSEPLTTGRKKAVSPDPDRLLYLTDVLQELDRLRWGILAHYEAVATAKTVGRLTGAALYGREGEPPEFGWGTWRWDPRESRSLTGWRSHPVPTAPSG